MNRPTRRTTTRAGSRRRRVLEYLASHGGELRSETGQGLRRQIAEALNERPTMVSQTIIALERAGLVERELDVDRHRCYAIRLTTDDIPPPAQLDLDSDDISLPTEGDAEALEAELVAAQQDLKDTIREASRISRRVQELQTALAGHRRRDSVSPG